MKYDLNNIRQLYAFDNPIHGENIWQAFKSLQSRIKNINTSFNIL